MGIWLVFQQGFYWTLRRERVKRLLWQTWCWTSTRVALRKSTFFHQPSSLMTTGLDGCEKIHWQRNGHQTHWWKPHLLWHLWGEGLEERNRHAGRNNKVYDSLCWIHVFLHQKNDSYHKMWGGSCIFPFQPNPMFNENTSKLHQILTSKVQFHEFSIKFPTQAAMGPQPLRAHPVAEWWCGSGRSHPSVQNQILVTSYWIIGIIGSFTRKERSFPCEKIPSGND